MLCAILDAYPRGFRTVLPSMLNHTLPDLLQTIAGIAAFALYFLAPGYLIATAADIFRFNTRSFPEKVLWSVALSGPLSIIIATTLGRALSARSVEAIFLTLGLIAIAVAFIQLRRGTLLRRADFDRSFWIAAVCMAGIAVYGIFATLGIHIHHSLYESVVSCDWSVRIPLIDAAVRGGVPPANPFYAFAGQSPAMRYYYYWYVLCAQVVRLTGISPHNCLAASTVWSAFSVLSVVFLFLKYLAPLDTIAPIFSGNADSPVSPSVPLRRICLAALALVPVLGLDLVPTISGLFFHRVRLQPELEWWRSDRIPSWIGSILYAPHHMAGLAFGTTGFLLLALLPPSAPGQRGSAGRRILHALLAAICFAALAGTSTYIALFFAIAGVFLLLVKVRFRRWSDLGMLLLCAVIALLLARPFLHEMTSNTGYSAAQHLAAGSARDAAGNHFLKIVLRNWHNAYGLVSFGFSALHRDLHASKLRYVYCLPVLLVLYIMEFSFYLFVLWYQARADFSGAHADFGSKKHSASEHSLILWALFLGFALPALFLSSEPTQQVNDLGRHAGLALRFSLLLWAAPMFANTWHSWRNHRALTSRGRLVVRLTIIAIVLGIGAQIWQIALERIYLPLVAHRLINPRPPFVGGAPYADVRDAFAVIGTQLPAGAIIQSNPEGIYQSVFQLYQDRQMAAGDAGCESAFGGDYNLCKTAILPPLHGLFGGRGKNTYGTRMTPFNPATMTDADFNAACQDLHLTALLAASEDPAWWFPQSWVWNEKLLYANSNVRVLACPAFDTTAALKASHLSQEPIAR